MKDLQSNKHNTRGNKVMTETNNRISRILIIEEDPTELRHLKNLLREPTYQMIVVSDEREALRYVLDNPDTVPLIASGMHTQLMNGYEFLRKLSEHPILRTMPFHLKSGAYFHASQKEEVLGDSLNIGRYTREKLLPAIDKLPPRILASVKEA